MRRIALCLTLVSAAVGGAASCGGGEGSRLSVAEFEERGNAACLRYREAIADEIADLGPGEPTAEDAQQVMIEAVVPAQQRQLEALRELEPPEELADDFEEFLGETAQAVDTLLDWAENDPDRLLDDDPFPEFDDRAADLGLSACGSS